MLKTRDLSIGFRLFMGFLSITLFSISIGVIALLNSDKYLNTIDDLYNHPYTISNSVQEIETHIVSIHLAMKDIALTDDNNKIDFETKSVAELDEEITRLFAIVSKEFLGNQQDVTTAWNSFKAWKPIRSEIIELAKNGKKDQAEEITIGKETLIILDLNKKMKKMKEFAHQKANSFWNSSLEQGKLLFRTILFILLISIFLSIYISHKITKSIKHPIKKMNAISEAIQQGDLNIRNEITTKDELDSLAQGINNMTDSLRMRVDIQNGISSINKSLIGSVKVKDFAKKLLECLLEVTNSNSANFYLLKENKKSYVSLASIATNKNSLRNFPMNNPPGEFGIAIMKKRMQIVDGLQNHPGFEFTTSVGNYAPKEILTFPILRKNKVKAIISLSNLKKYTPENTEILTLSSPAINIAFEKLLSVRKTKSLAENLMIINQKLEVQSEELREQTNELQEQSHELQNQATELYEKNKSLEVKTLEVEQANRLKSEFLSNMSHELRTPLNSIMALSRTLIMQTKDKLSEEENSYLEIVERNGTNLLQLINDILDLSKIEAGKMDVYPSQIKLHPILKLLQENIEPIANQKGIKLEIRCSDNLPNFDSDEVRLSQILTNLISNAIKFTEKGYVVVSAFQDKEQIKIEVKDTGIGIPQKNLESIFDEFTQIDGSSSRQYQGTGLGLAIVNKLVKMLGGKINVSSQIDKGSCFTLTLPLEWYLEKDNSPFVLNFDSHFENGSSSVKDKLNLTSGLHAKSLNDTRILMIEDNETAIIQMKHVLEMKGYIVDVAHGGKEAFEYINHTIPDGIILDLMMPEIDGFEVLEQIRSKENTANIPVVILTAKDLTREDLSRLSANNVQQLIQKGDVNIEALLSKIHKMFGQSEQLGTSENVSTPKTALKIKLKKDTKAKVLIIEDNPDNMVTIKSILGSKYEIHEAVDGEKGLEMINTLLPHLVLLDMALPKIDGLEVLRRVKSDKRTQHIPVIALTAMAMIEDKKAMLQAGCDAYVTKPVGHLEILSKIENFFI
ncbi:response regulator [Labilibaculum sp. K2S]|uniref:response regulator n=1 Tax=Labilibaculum sp. K2S TaxID=3056386 RepID=UPI0025A3D7B4|nr:response regulator [Labilibaculum sp. K2S]MDM8159538.1 response regulator [Labilibaculum sp. K2S]